MIISSSKKKYEILGVFNKNQKIERYFCKELLDEIPCCMIRIIDKICIAKTVVFFRNEMQKETFKEFIDFFMCDSALCLVFSQNTGITLEQKIKEEEPSFQERLAIFAAILAQLTVLDMDSYFAVDCLNSKSIFLTQGLTVSFSHWMKHLDEFTPYEYNPYEFQSVIEKVRNVYNYLFHKEIKRKSIPDLLTFDDELIKEDCKNYLVLYELFSAMQKRVEKIDSTESLKPQTILFRIWEKIAGLFKPLKKVFILLLFLAAIGFLIYNVEQGQKTGKEKHIFERIGTLEIQK